MSQLNAIRDEITADAEGFGEIVNIDTAEGVAPNVVFLDENLQRTGAFSPTIVEDAQEEFSAIVRHCKNFVQRRSTKDVYNLLWVTPAVSQWSPLTSYVADAKTNEAGLQTLIDLEEYWKSTRAGLGLLELDEFTYLDPVQRIDYDGLHSQFNVDVFEEYRRAVGAAEHSLDAVLAELGRRVDAARAAHMADSPSAVVRSLADVMGVSQLLVARAVGVTPTAVRKWRRGETARAEYRGRLAQFAGLCDLLAEIGVHDPDTWLEASVSSESSLSPLDLFQRGRSDLILALAEGVVEPQQALDLFDEHWREQYSANREYEVIRMSDGTKSIVPRSA